MPFTILIPARLSSTRLPNKPLADIAGLPMVVRVAQRASLSQAQRVVVVTDSHEIVQVCKAHTIEALLTRAEHPSGSDRLAQACELLALEDHEIVVNVQGDEPLIDPNLIDAVATLLQHHTSASMSTAAHAIESLDDFHNPNVVKVVCDAQGLALYFSRAPIPFAREQTECAWWHSGASASKMPAPLRHIGLYGYRAGFLRQFPSLEQAPMELLESLEQLRALWHGHRIAVHITHQAPGPGVDTHEDLERVRALLTAT